MENVLQDEAKVTEQLLARQAALKLRRGDLERRIRDLGSLPAEAYGDAHRGKSAKQLQRALKQANERLKQCGWVTHTRTRVLQHVSTRGWNTGGLAFGEASPG